MHFGGWETRRVFEASVVVEADVANGAYAHGERLHGNPSGREEVANWGKYFLLDTVI